MNIFIEKLKDIDAESLRMFEIENRDFFEEMVPSRGDDYYKPDVFKLRHDALLKEQRKGTSIFYVIKDENNSILGRINLVDIDKQSQIGFLGYRVGYKHTGKGIAKKALQLLLEKIDKLEIKEIKAKTTTNNIASQKVLEKNGFERIEVDDEVFEMKNRTLKFVHYKWSSQKNF